MEHSIAIVRREAEARPYEAEPLIARVRDLLAKTHHTSRAAALGATLDHQAINRILAGQRPNMIACILLADYFGLNPNEMLELAAWPKLEVFEVRAESAANLPLEAVEVALDLAKIPQPGDRKKVAEAVRTLISKHMAG
jgi:hypothetical protein